MAKKKAPYPAKNLIITQCAFRQDSVADTRQYLVDAGHVVRMSDEKIAGKLSKRLDYLESKGMMEDRLDCTQSAPIIGVTARRVRAICINGRLGRKLTSSYIISREELLEFLKVERKVGNPDFSLPRETTG